MSPQASHERQSIESLYALKAVCTFFVVALHSKLCYLDLYKPFLMVAVPVFFMITGYFLRAKSHVEGDSTAALGMLKHAVVITATVNLAYMLFLSCIRQNFQAFLPFNLIKIFVFTGAVYAYWYLVALCEALLFLYLLFKYFPSRWLQPLLYIFPFLFVGAVLYGSYYGLVKDHNPEIFWTNNACFVGIPCITTGYLIRKHEKKLCKRCFIYIAPIVFSITSMVEMFVSDSLPFRTGNDFRVSTLPLAISLFIVCLLHRRIGSGLLAHIGKYHSANIYYMHVAVIIIWSKLYVTQHPAVGDFRAVFVFLLCIPLSSLTNKMIGKLKHHRQPSTP